MSNQADRVRSTPPTNTPIDTTRRQVLSVAAVGAVAVLLPTTALATPSAIDPLFALIEIHRKSHLDHMASLALEERFVRRYGAGHRPRISEEPCCAEHDAFEALLTAPATTMRGLVAVLDYYQELSSEFETEWMINDRAEASVLIQSFAASLKNIGGQP